MIASAFPTLLASMGGCSCFRFILSLGGEALCYVSGGSHRPGVGRKEKCCLCISRGNLLA